MTDIGEAAAALQELFAVYPQFYLKEENRKILRGKIHTRMSYSLCRPNIISFLAFCRRVGGMLARKREQPSCRID